jgi:hypothetical protein
MIQCVDTKQQLTNTNVNSNIRSVSIYSTCRVDSQHGRYHITQKDANNKDYLL